MSTVGWTFATSADPSTACTPAMARAGLRSMDAIRALGAGDRTNASSSIRGNWMSVT